MKLCASYGTAVKTHDAKVTVRSSPLPGMLHLHNIYSSGGSESGLPPSCTVTSMTPMRHLSAGSRRPTTPGPRVRFHPLSSGEACCQRGPLHVRAVFRRHDALSVDTRDLRLAFEAHKDFHVTLTLPRSRKAQVPFLSWIDTVIVAGVR